ncbi:MAG: CvpA family protein [Verrucomicrobiia bacterium]
MVENVMVAISVLAILVILGLGRLGMHFGAFYEATSTLLLFLAMMVSLRYWYPLTRWVVSWWSPDTASYAAFGSYWALFLIGCLPLILFMSRVTQGSIPSYPKIVDMVVGMVFGTISATILVCCVMTSLSVIAPKIWEPYNRNALTLPLDQVPIHIYRAVEKNWLHIGTNDCAHTRFPTFDKANVDDFDKYWK